MAADGKQPPPLAEKRYTLPPEWASQSGVMLAWPTAESDWGPWLKEIETVYLNIAREIAHREKLLVVCHCPNHLAQVKNQLAQQNINPASLSLHVVPFNDTWVRDYGPLGCLGLEGQLQLLDFVFNGWGGKYEANLDNEVTARLHGQGVFGAVPLKRSQLTLEGGSIEVDGAGSLLTTTRCLLSGTRNRGLGQAAIETQLKQWLGVERILWLRHGQLSGDDTDGHIDTLARFCNPQTICYVACDDPKDEQYLELQTMAEELRLLQTLGGIPYRLVPLPWPAPKVSANGERLPASYANFLIINGAVLAPTYRDSADTQALSILQTCFPDRQVVGIDCLPLIQQYGSLHCITMQLPAGIL
ncbi:agmatine deiminase [Nitrosococcus oceani ATCC 19707]|uniref:Agmatine deiminase n=2 Tax=Nitrosococcus oceani TaxID=1229 RepID=Q3J8E5_NITOC|nr:agmatine deiminase family protein [Nitrosococcus oceani]ABA58901.1 agmatine deiminase [Nitrosococcus oceani ATCC 19707]EDZ67018.1 Porphyromonas-type peptidyl-arginine deiminase superfamily [Nitrosococcus oceani AFC27]KFI18701.1 agmatine deiminase [Nitrosococcus oceani C-27]